MAHKGDCEMKNEIDKAHYCISNNWITHNDAYPDHCRLAWNNGSRLEGKEYCKRCRDYCYKWPTPEQYKAKYDEDWPDDGAVYYRRKQRRIEASSWIAGHYAYPWSHAPDREDLQIVCACTPWGKPPDDWMPE
jgi:hypothetical protein